MDDFIYVVFEGGGIEYEPKTLGVFNDTIKAKECVKAAMISFLEIFDPEPEAFGTRSAIIEKQIFDNNILFYIYQDEEEQSYGAAANIFVISEVPNTLK
jgi:hypothetical protein